MKRSIIAFVLLMAVVTGVKSQAVNENYSRSSIYSLCISHQNTTYCKEINEVFVAMPVPDKFDNHDLNIKILTSPGSKEDEKSINRFLTTNNVGRRLVGKWFDRDPANGQCGLEIISRRGLYDADYYDVELARQSIRGEAMLKDAGEELIKNTFVLVNDIRYVDKENSAKIGGAVLRGLGHVAGPYALNITDQLARLVEGIRGFRVIVTSYLYQLEWNDDVAAKFYNDYYIGAGRTDEAKRMAFNDNNYSFNLRFIGEKRIDSGETSYAGVFEPKGMIRKVCMRAIDKSVVELQKAYDEFKVKTPIYAVSPDITAKIGMKEGMTDKSRYEVLERVQDDKGITHYKRVGVIAPVPGKIWDNRYMAVEEKSEGSDFTCSTFKKVSGGDFQPGMLIREMKIQ